MTIEAADLLGLAQELVQGDGECKWRSAVSRSYYAAYHQCLAWEQTLPKVGHAMGYAGGSHQQLINRLRNPDSSCTASQQTQSRLLAAKLEVQRTRRHVSDYELGPVISKAECETHVAQVQSLLSSCTTAS